MKTRNYWKAFMAGIAGLSSITTLVSFLNQEITSSLSLGIQGLMASLIILLSLSYAYLVTRKRKQMSMYTNLQTNVIVEEGDIFKRKGIIVIPVNEYFDTHVGNNIISKDSVHGKFVSTYFEHRVGELDQRIAEKLSKLTPCENVERTPGKSAKYPLGTCIDIEDGGNRYVLFAFTHFDKNNVSYIDCKEFGPTVVALVNYLASISENVPVYMPLFGTNFGRMKQSPQRILTYILDMLAFYNAPTILGGLHIEILSIDKQKIDLDKLESILN
jgi:hypothetical protein